MPNKVFLNSDNIQEIIIEGDQHIEAFKAAMEESARLDEETKVRGIPLKSLVDISKMGELDRQVIYEALHNIINRDYVKSAIYGHYETHNPIVNFFLKDMEHISNHRMRVFDDRTEALKWLRDEIN